MSSVSMKRCYSSSKRRGFLSEEDILCVSKHCGFLNQASPLHSNMCKINILSLTHTHTYNYLVCWGDTPQFVKVSQVSAGLVVWLIINSRPNKEQTGNKLTGFLYGCTLSSTFCSMSDNISYPVVFHLMQAAFRVIPQKKLEWFLKVTYLTTCPSVTSK